MLSSAAIIFVNDGVIDDVVEIFINHSRKPLDPDLTGQQLWAMNAEAMRHEKSPISVNESLRYAHHLRSAQAYRFQRGSDCALQQEISCACFLKQSDRPVNANNPLLRELKLINEAASEPASWAVDEVWNREREDISDEGSGAFERLLL